MPSKSRKQAKLMAAAAHSREFAKKIGIKFETAVEWHEEDKKLEAEGKASYEAIDNKDLLIEEALNLHAGLESLQTQGLVLHTRGEVTDNELEAFKDLGNRILAPVDLNVDGPETVSAVDASTDLELTLEHLQYIKRNIQKVIFKEAGVEETLSLESFQEIFGNIHIPEASPQANNVTTKVMLTPSARGIGQPADANAVKWIEANHNLNALKTLVGLIRSSSTLKGEEFSAAKRLLKQLMTTSGFYLDNVDYANTLPELEKILDEAIASVATQVSMTWSPGMPGYGMEGIFSGIMNIFKGKKRPKVDTAKPFAVVEKQIKDTYQNDTWLDKQKTNFGQVPAKEIAPVFCTSEGFQEDILAQAKINFEEIKAFDKDYWDKVSTYIKDSGDLYKKLIKMGPTSESIKEIDEQLEKRTDKLNKGVDYSLPKVSGWRNVKTTGVPTNIRCLTKDQIEEYSKLMLEMVQFAEGEYQRSLDALNKYGVPMTVDNKKFWEEATKDRRGQELLNMFESLAWIGFDPNKADINNHLIKTAKALNDYIDVSLKD